MWSKLAYGLLILCFSLSLINFADLIYSYIQLRRVRKEEEKEQDRVRHEDEERVASIQKFENIYWEVVKPPEFRGDNILLQLRRCLEDEDPKELLVPNDDEDSTFLDLKEGYVLKVEILTLDKECPWPKIEKCQFMIFPLEGKGMNVRH